MTFTYHCRNCGVRYFVVSPQLFESREDALWKSGPTGQHDCDPGIAGVSDLVAVTDRDNAPPQSPP